MRFRILLLVMAVAVIPACKANQQLAAPALIGGTPTSSTESAMPNILMEFDREMDAADMMNKVNFGVFAGTSSTSIGISVEYLPALNQVRIIPASLLTQKTQYTVLVAGTVKSAKGTPMGNTNGFMFTTKDTLVSPSIVSWGGLNSIATGAGAAGTVDLDIKSAQQSIGGGGLTDIAATYNIYYSLTPGAEDLIKQPLSNPPIAPGAQTITLPLSNTLYYLKIQPVDSDGAVCTSLSEVTVTTK